MSPLVQVFWYRNIPQLLLFSTRIWRFLKGVVFLPQSCSWVPSPGGSSPIFGGRLAPWQLCGDPSAKACTAQEVDCWSQWWFHWECWINFLTSLLQLSVFCLPWHFSQSRHLNFLSWRQNFQLKTECYHTIFVWSRLVSKSGWESRNFLRSANQPARQYF